ncbi:hypothetical protein HYW32_02025 [Candidatus Berkelbacteria bacterium]|nr:hypothetical protein [Candidatus Berkelbacteria bacterium]
MLDTNRVTSVTIQWTTITYLVCSAFVALFPGFALWVSRMTFHLAQVGDLDRARLTFPGFFVGLIFWNIVAYLGSALFAWLWNQKSK